MTRRREPMPKPADKPRRAPMRIDRSVIGAIRQRETRSASQTYALPTYAPGVLPNGKTILAMDDADQSLIQQQYAAFGAHGLFAEGIGFAGYPYLAELAQRPEYRRASEVIAEEMTREWIEVTATGDEDKADTIKVIETELKRHDIRAIMRRAVEIDGFMGMSMIFIDLGDRAPEELRAPLPLVPEKVGKGTLKGFRVIDPTWIGPLDYDARDPLAPDFYRPRSWFVMGTTVHASRLMHIVSRPVPDALKPAYNFGGLSLSQMMKPYVDNWLSTRQAVADLIKAFTVFVLKTNMDAVLQGPVGDAMSGLIAQATAAESLTNRLDLFNAVRSNSGLLAVDKETEELANISAPLSGLDHLQAQSQEQMASVTAIPLVKLLGIQPSGLNASSEGEIRVFYDSIKARQERVLAPIIETILKVIQLDRFGAIDPEIGFRFLPLWQVDEQTKATTRKIEAETDQALLDMGVLAPEDVRRRIAAEPDSPYAGLDMELPERPDGTEEDGEMRDALSRLMGDA